jgi:choline monooxygenase
MSGAAVPVPVAWPVPMVPSDRSWLAPQAPEQALALPAHCYVGAMAAQRDRDMVLARGWQLLARTSQLARSGDHVTGDLAGVPLVLLRDEAGGLRALHNVCRHRGGPLVRCSGSGLRVLSCQYHGWTYALDGVLRGAPDMAGVPGFDPAAVRLPAARLAVWQGLVFGCLDESAPPFKAVVAGIDARLGGLDLARHVFHRRVVYDVDCDWKLYVDNYLEGYHVPKVHPGLNALLDYRSYTTTLARWHSLQFSPLESAPDLYGAGEALYYFLYPNTMLNILPGRLQTNRVLPAGEGRCRVEFDYAYAPGAWTPARIDADLAFSDAVQAEDAAICADVQRGLRSGSYQPGRLNPAREQGVHHFHELLRDAYRSSLNGDGV